MRIKTSLPSFAYVKLSDKKYVSVNQDGYIEMSVEDFLMFYRRVILYTEYVEGVEPEYYEKLASILPKNKIITKKVEEVKETKQNDVLESAQLAGDESDKAEPSPSSNNEESERPRRRRISK